MTPNPTEVFKNLLPILESAPTASATSLILAPETSHNDDKLFIDEIL